MKNKRPKCSIVKSVASRYLENIISVEPVHKGTSTFVYRLITETGIFYIRFLPEKASFASEVLVHNTLYELDVKVPKVIAFEHKDKETNLSVMIIEEIAGICLEDSDSQLDFKEILRNAGKQLALIHTISVDGFGWIDKSSHIKLKGENQRFEDYFNLYLENDLQALCKYSFSNEEIKQIRRLMISAGSILNVEKAVLVHGDFDISHIFHKDGRYTGIIDFGEVRGNNRLYDLATFAGFYQDRKLYSYLLKGYCEITPLSARDLYATELMALFIILRFLGKKVNTKFSNHWFKLAKKQLNHINNLDNVEQLLDITRH
ncbi:aminoglycoside phosphotransferase family protein [Haloplasma contractile]|uniref:Phosphotransferase protein n=1 Tax=Haloplasma contractile SSD-17B TaxID=1033810 RepID=U2E739_9MOLU|nr:aminoglycoside phosphotransferase family protein [Haloplasma contractile]ERJ11008.1 Putative phosphotransferase protein [Haloplasma contractile SSD-17B]